MNRTVLTILAGVLLLGGLVGVIALWRPGPADLPGAGPGPGPGAADQEPAAEAAPLRLGLVPERNIFEQRRRYRLLADHLAERLGRPIELVTFSTYHGVLHDFEHGAVDAAFLGSFITVLVHERFSARVLVKPEYPDEMSTYRGVVFVRDDSPVRSLQELGEGCIAMVRATMAGHLFPLVAMEDVEGWDPDDEGAICWISSHDEVIEATAAGHVAAGAAKDLRLKAFEQANPDIALRRLAESGPVPENALVVAATLDEQVAAALKEALLTLHEEPEGRALAERIGVARFLPCDIEEYGLVYELVDRLRERWATLGIQGPAPPGWPRSDAPARSTTPAPSPD